MLCHLTALAMVIFPFGNVIGPLVVWLIKKNEMPLVDAEGKKALNFQITMTIASLVALVLCVIFIGMLLLPVLLLGNIIVLVIASVKTSNGEDYVYPFSFTFIK